MRLDCTHAEGLTLLTAVRSRELYLRQVLQHGSIDTEILRDIDAEVALLDGLITALALALANDTYTKAAGRSDAN